MFVTKDLIYVYFRYGTHDVYFSDSLPRKPLSLFFIYKIKSKIKNLRISFRLYTKGANIVKSLFVEFFRVVMFCSSMYT